METETNEYIWCERESVTNSRDFGFKKQMKRTAFCGPNICQNTHTHTHTK